MIMAGIRMISEWARTIGSANPITTKNPVQNLPKSTTAPLPPLSTKSSGLAHLPQIQLGRGARTKVATTSSGRYCLNKAHERITRRKPIARMNDSEMIVLSPAVILKSGKGDRLAVGSFISAKLMRPLDQKLYRVSQIDGPSPCFLALSFLGSATLEDRAG